jgi:hypothetical protein
VPEQEVVQERKAPGPLSGVREAEGPIAGCPAASCKIRETIDRVDGESGKTKPAGCARQAAIGARTATRAPTLRARPKSAAHAGHCTHRRGRRHAAGEEAPAVDRRVARTRGPSPTVIPPAQALGPSGPPRLACARIPSIIRS